MIGGGNAIATLSCFAIASRGLPLLAGMGGAEVWEPSPLLTLPAAAGDKPSAAVVVAAAAASSAVGSIAAVALATLGMLPQPWGPMLKLAAVAIVLAAANKIAVAVAAEVVVVAVGTRIVAGASASAAVAAARPRSAGGQTSGQ